MKVQRRWALPDGPADASLLSLSATAETSNHRSGQQGSMLAVVFELYCPLCSLFLAASPHPVLLDFVERMHRCPLALK